MIHRLWLRGWLVPSTKYSSGPKENEKNQTCQLLASSRFQCWLMVFAFGIASCEPPFLRTTALMNGLPLEAQDQSHVWLEKSSLRRSLGKNSSSCMPSSPILMRFFWRACRDVGRTEHVNYQPIQPSMGDILCIYPSTLM